LTSLCVQLINKNHPLFKIKLINYPPLLYEAINLLLWFRRVEELKSRALVKYYK